MAAPFAYITNNNAGSNSVSVIDLATNIVTATIPITPALAQPYGVAVNGSGTRVYISNTGADTVSVINTATNAVIANIPVAGGPRGIAINPAGTRVYATDISGGFNDIKVIDTSTNSVIATITGLDSPRGVVFNSTGTRAYVANNVAPGTVAVIDTATNAVISTAMSGGNGPYGIAVNAAGNRVYVANRTGGNVTVFDSSTGLSLLTNITVGSSPTGITLNPANTRAFVGNNGSNTISVIDLSTNTVSNSFASGFGPVGINVDPAGTRLVVVNENGDNVSVFDPVTFSLLATIPVGASPEAFGNFIGTPPALTVPGAPTSPVATAGNTTATVTFVVPASTGGSAITGYTVTSNPAGGTDTNAGTTGLSHAITGLTNGTPYTFTVTATNAIGTSVASAASNSVTPAAPVSFTVTATSTADSGPGSLRDAITQVSATCAVTSNVINFNIAGGGPHIILPTSALPTLTCANTTINGYSQSGASPNTLANGVSGSNAVIKIVLDGSGVTSGGLHVAANNIDIRGLSIVGFASDNAIFVTGNAANIVGNFLGTRPDGTSAPNNRGVDIFGSVVQVGGPAFAARNIIACNTNMGVFVDGGSADILNNDIGATSTATMCGNGGGIRFLSGAGSVGNIGSGNFIRNSAGDGIFVDSSNGVTISSNIINSNAGDGIKFGKFTDCASVGVRITRNSIGTNGGLGIQLDSVGGPRLANDALDADGGSCNTIGNFGQNHPIIDRVTYRPNGSLINYTMASEPGITYDIEIFTSIAPDVTNRGRGETVAGFTTITTGAGGTASVTNLQIVPTPNAANISLLATRQSTGDTSEFSPAYVTPFDFLPATGLAAYSITAGTPQTRVITFLNKGVGTVTPAIPTITGTANFTITADTCGSNAISPTGNCQITVQYNRATAGSDLGTLSLNVPVTSNSFTGADTLYEIPLTGSAIAAAASAITVTGTTTFPGTAVGASSGLQAITITNTGAGILTLNSITHNNASIFPDTTGGPAPNGAHWCGFGSVAGGAPNTGMPININPVASCVVNLVFSPNVTGALTGVITVNSNAPTSPTMINVSGAGLPPNASIAPASILFGNAPVSLGVNQISTFNNPSAAPYTITSLSIAGLGFTVAPTGASPCSVGAVVNGGGNCTYTATFTPTGTGSTNGTATVGFQPFGTGPSYNATQSTNGNGFTPPSSLAPTSVLFGNVPVGNTVNQVVSFTNDSNTTAFPSTYTITSLTTSGLGFTAVGSGGTPCAVSLTLLPGATCSLTVTLVLPGVGSTNGTTTIGYLAGLGANPPYSAAIGSNGIGVSVAPTITSVAPPGGTLGIPYAFAFTASGTAPFTWTVATGTLPNGLTLTAAGLLSGTPSATGTFLFTVQASNATMPNATQPVTLIVGALPTPTMTVAFAPTSVNTSVNSTMTLTLTNPNASPATMSLGGAVAMPPGLSLSGLVDGCGASASIVVSTVTTINLGMAGSIPAMGSCTITVQAQSASAGSFPVTVLPGNLITSLGNNSNTSIATLVVTPLPVPTMTVAFAPGSVSAGVNSTLTLTLTNPSASPAVISIGGSVSVPGLTMSGLVDGCSASASISAATINLGMAGSIPAMGSCTITVQAKSPTAGTFPVTVSPGNLVTSLGNNTNTSTASLTVNPLSAPTLSLVATNSVVAGGVFVLSISVSNPIGNPTISGITTSVITYPVGFVNDVANASYPSGNPVCGGTFTAWNAGGNTFGLAGGTVNANQTCLLANAQIIAPAIPGTYTFSIPTGMFAVTAPVPFSNAAPVTKTITVTAAAAPALTFAPASNVNFGTRTINTTSPVSTVTLTNTGTANLIISSIIGSGDFAFTSTCPISTPPIVPTGTCTVGITFTPLTAALGGGGVTITSNAPGSPHVISLTGTGAAVAVAGITITPTNAGFGAITVGTNSSPQSVSVKNTGLATLNLTSITVSPPFSRVTPALPTPPDCLATLAPNAICQIAVIFTPNAVSSFLGQISIVHNAGGSPALVALNGVGTPIPVAQIRAPASIDFGDQIIAGSGTQTLTIANPGTATLNISAMTLSGTDAARFAPSGTCASINAGASCAITITFTPTTVGAKTAQITIASNANSQSSVTVNLTGNGILAPRPIVELSVTAIGFGNNIFGGATSSQNVTLRNGGGVALAIQGILTAGDFVLANGCPASLASTASCVISIQFSPLGVGGRSGELVLNTNATGSPHRIPLSGTGCRWFSQATSRFFLTSCSN